MIEIFCDGAFSSIRNAGGLALVILKDNKKILEYSNKYTRCSNNSMELGAVIVALRLIKEPIDSITIYTDSEYVRGCATLGWQRKKNKKLWQEFDLQYDRVKKLCPNIQIIHVDGHQKDNSKETYWNNYVDQLAVKQSQLL